MTIKPHHKHILTTVGIFLPLVIAGYVLYKYFKKSSITPFKSSNTGGGNAGGSTGTTSATPAGFPLKKGVKNSYVAQLQTALNKAYNTKLTVDGNWGPLTDSAVSGYLSLTQISSVAQLNTIVANLNYVATLTGGLGGVGSAGMVNNGAGTANG